MRAMSTRLHSATGGPGQSAAHALSILLDVGGIEQDGVDPAGNSSTPPRMEQTLQAAVPQHLGWPDISSARPNGGGDADPTTPAHSKLPAKSRRGRPRPKVAVAPSPTALPLDGGLGTDDGIEPPEVRRKTLGGSRPVGRPKKIGSTQLRSRRVTCWKHLRRTPCGGEER